MQRQQHQQQQKKYTQTSTLWQRLHRTNIDYTILGCCTLAFVLYLNTLNAGFVYDDSRALLNNPDVMGSKPDTNSLTHFLTHDFWGTPLTDAGSHGSWRPLCVLSFRLNFLLASGFIPWSYHLINNMLHCLATALVIKVARTLHVPRETGSSTSQWGIAATGILFAVHPIHTEAVAGIVGRADLGACICYLLTYLVYLRHIQIRGKAALGEGQHRHHHQQQHAWFALVMTLLLAVCALLFKETAITALLICGLSELLQNHHHHQHGHHQQHSPYGRGYAYKQRLRALCILGAAFGCMVYCRLVKLPQPQTTFSKADNPIIRTQTIWTRFLTLLYLPVFNFKLLLYPEVLSFDWGMDALTPITTLWDYRNLATCSFYAIICTVIWHCNKRIWFSSQETNKISTRNVVQRKSRPKLKEHNLLRFNGEFNWECNNKCYATLMSQLPYKVHLSYNNNHYNNKDYCKDWNKNAQETHKLNAQETNNTKKTNFRYERQHGKTSSSKILYTTHDLCYFTSSLTSSISESSSTSSSSSSSSASRSHSSSSSSNNFNFSGNSIKSYSLNLLPEVEASGIREACTLLMCFAFLILPFLPATNLFFYVGFVVAERLLYLPSVGYCLLVGFGLTKLMESTRRQCKQRRQCISFIIITFGVLLILTLSIRTVRRNQDWRDEESLYRSAIQVNPPKALGNLGSVLSTQGRYEEAKTTLNAALRYRPNMADVHFNLGILHQNQMEYNEAVSCFQRAIHFRPSLAVAYLNLGISLIALDERSKAIEILQLGSRVSGTNVRDRDAHEEARSSAYLQLASLYVQDDKYQRALAIYREALETMPKQYQKLNIIYQHMAELYAKMGQLDQAEHYHRKALILQPNHVATHISYGTMLSRNSSRSSEAEMWFKRALQLAPTEASVHHYYAEFLTEQERYQEALGYHQRAADLNSLDYNLVVALAEALRLSKHFTDAEVWYRKALMLRPNSAQAHANLGALQHLLGHIDKAMHSYKKALSLEPNHGITLANVAKLNAKLRRPHG